MKAFVLFHSPGIPAARYALFLRTNVNVIRHVHSDKDARHDCSARSVKNLFPKISEYGEIK